MTEVGMRSLVVLLIAVSIPIAPTLQAQVSQRNPSQPPEVQATHSATLKVTFLGTGGGPRPNPSRYGASILIEAGTEDLLFDCGRGVTIRLVQAGVPLRRVSKVFLTHLHSDHVIGIPDLLLTGWGTSGRTVPFEICGPAGTRRMMESMLKTFAFDIHSRRDVYEKFSPAGISVRSRDIHEGIVFQNGETKVTAFTVDHGPVRPAFGYRVDYRGRSIALSGDTRRSENLIRFSQGVDVLVHSATNAEGLRQASEMFATAEQIEKIAAYSITPEEAGEVFARVKPRLAVYSHIGNFESLVAATRKAYSGPLEGAVDLMTIEVGDEVIVRRPAR
jgi:ribonuclease Z